jgi:hypothetical protein
MMLKKVNADALGGRDIVVPGALCYTEPLDRECFTLKEY